MNFFKKYIPNLFIHMLYRKVNFNCSIYRGMYIGREGLKLFLWSAMLKSKIHVKKNCCRNSFSKQSVLVHYTDYSCELSHTFNSPA